MNPFEDERELADPFPCVPACAGNGPPMRVVIVVRLAALCCGDWGAVRGEVVALPEGSCGVEVFGRAAHGV